MNADGVGRGWGPVKEHRHTDGHIHAALAWLDALEQLPRWRRWLWSRLPGNWATFWLIDRLGPTGTRERRQGGVT